MSFLVVGLSHRQTPIDVLERAAITPQELDQTLARVLSHEQVTEAMVLSTCNRVEIYANVEKFHPGLDAMVEWLSDRLDTPADELAQYLQVSYDEDAIEHMMRVASGLDSMIVGEPQILGQLRTAYLDATDREAIGRKLHALAQHALRVGKRMHSDLGMHEVGRNIAAVAVDAASSAAGGLTGKRALIVGAGAMATLAAASLREQGVGSLQVVNRSPEKAAALAARFGGEATADLTTAVRAADIVVTALGSSPGVLTEQMVLEAGETVLVDLALPKNVTAEAAGLPSVTYIGMDRIRERAQVLDLAVDGARADDLIAEEVAAFVARQRSSAVAPTIAALRNRAKEVIDSEMDRLRSRIPDVDDRALAEIEYAVERVVDKMLHAPQVHVRESAGTPTGEAYAEALRMLFELGDQIPRDAAAPQVGESARNLVNGSNA